MLLWHCCSWCSNKTLLEMLISGQWVFVLNSWVSRVFCDTVAPDVQMRLCWKCWFEGNESLFLIPESPESFVTLLHLIVKWDFVGNVVLRAMRPCSLFLSLLSLLWYCCSFEHLLEMLIWGQWVFVLNSWVSWCFCDTVAPDCPRYETLLDNVWFEGNESLFLIPESHWSLLWHCCTWCSNETLLEMLIWGQWVFVLNSWVSWCFCDYLLLLMSQMRLCWDSCWFEGNESYVLNSTWVSTESHCEHLLHLMSQMRLCWDSCWFEGKWVICS